MNWFENLSVQKLKVDYAEIKAAYDDQLRDEVILALVTKGIFRSEIHSESLCFCQPIVEEFKNAGFAVSTKPLHKFDGKDVEQGLRVVIAFKQETSEPPR